MNSRMIRWNVRPSAKPSPDSLRKLPTVFGASSSNISKTIGPWLVVIVIWDMCLSPVRSGLPADRLERQLTSVDRGAAEGLDDPLGLGGRDLDEREALEHAHVADRLAVEA